MARAEEYPYSIPKAHVTGKRNPVLGEELFSSEDRGDYESLLGETLFPKSTEDLRYHSRRGTPLGGQDFVGRIEAELERSLVRKPPGIPKRKSKQPPAGSRWLYSLSITNRLSS